ncbi:MAG TPA: ACP S-malonyltransferase [Rhizomicrobium sp.]|jgi:[acyl-carrier-protein] S-malonyltransferase|nr:ACP S-malonyltransferase [Rhizomicrobium sp.]
MTRAFIFPGQGSQTVGMGKALAEAFAPAREVFQEVDDALSQRLSKLMWEGPESELVLTENAQPAIMAASMAVIRALEREAGLDLARHARLVAGHSLGEYSALCAAGAFALVDAARLLKLRGQAMQAAVPVGEGGMSALLGAEIDQAEALAKECAAATGGVCVVANDNAPGQVVISGTKTAIDKAPEIAKAMGVKRAMALNVSAPFHSPLMQPAADKMREALAQVTIRPPSVPVVANVTAAETSEPETIRRLLVEQVTARVRWRESVLAFRAFGVETTVEAGGAKVLTGMVKRIDRELQTVTLDAPADLEAFARTL